MYLAASQGVGHSTGGGRSWCCNASIRYEKDAVEGLGSVIRHIKSCFKRLSANKYHHLLFQAVASLLTDPNVSVCTDGYKRPSYMDQPVGLLPGVSRQKRCWGSGAGASMQATGLEKVFRAGSLQGGLTW